MGKTKFKIIIAGSRDFRDYEFLKQKCDKALKAISETHEIWIVSGTAEGADQLGERYALERGYFLIQCPAPWDDIKDKPKSEIRKNKSGKFFWKKAGLVRNEQMAEIADALIAFQKNKSGGTVHMIRTAEKNNLKIKVYEV